MLVVLTVSVMYCYFQMMGWNYLMIRWTPSTTIFASMALLVLSQVVGMGDIKIQCHNMSREYVIITIIDIMYHNIVLTGNEGITNTKNINIQ